MGHNLLVFALCLASVWLSFICFWTTTRMDSGWSANCDKSHPWVDSVPHFPKIGRLTAPVGYICWDFLFNVVVGSFGWTIRQDLFDDFTNLTRPSVEGGHWLFTIFTVGQRQGGLAISVMSFRLPCCIARNEESKKRKLICYQHHACGG
jgi:hypothetical protein